MACPSRQTWRSDSNRGSPSNSAGKAVIQVCWHIVIHDCCCYSSSHSRQHCLWGPCAPKALLLVRRTIMNASAHHKASPAGSLNALPLPSCSYCLQQRRSCVCRQLEAQIKEFAAGLRAAGLAQGDKVMHLVFQQPLSVVILNLSHSSSYIALLIGTYTAHLAAVWVPAQADKQSESATNQSFWTTETNRES